MNRILLFRLLLLSGLSTGLEAVEDGRSPDGRFQFVTYSSEEVDAGKAPAFGILETATGELVSNPDEDLGDASRPEETILWAPDSLSYALTSRVGTRHLDTLLYRWDGKSFVRAKWEDDGRIESIADEGMKADILAMGLPADTGLGQCIRGDDLPERWLDPSRLILACILEYSVGDGERGGIARGEGRAIVRWEESSQSYQIERVLPPSLPWPARVEDAGAHEVVQQDKGELVTSRLITVRHRETGESTNFEAENWLNAPLPLASFNGWPQLELVSEGPEGFERRRLYRFAKGGYRCVRFLDLTRLPRQAPDEAVRFEVEPGYEPFILRDREVKPGEVDTYESFQTESIAPGGRWKAVFTYHPQYLQRIEIVSADGTGEPTVIFDFDEGTFGAEVFTEPLWSPHGSSLALYVQDGLRAGATWLFRPIEGVWTKVDLPEIDYGFLKEATDRNQPWGRQLEIPLFWKNPRELVLRLEGDFRGDGGFDYAATASLTWSESGEPDKCVTREIRQAAE